MQYVRYPIRVLSVHVLKVSLPCVAVILLLGAQVALPFDEVDLPDAHRPSARSERATGLGYIDLPLGFRARFEAAYTNDLYVSDELARPYTADVGPNLRIDPALESSIALTRSISDKIEIGIAWGARTPIVNADPFDFDRQSVRAMVQIVP
jgi:hypothetical protein